LKRALTRINCRQGMILQSYSRPGCIIDPV
jgi:hypothetical protein